MTPASLDSAFMCFIFPADRLNFNLLCEYENTRAVQPGSGAIGLSLSIMTRNPPEVGLRAANVAQDLSLQLLRAVEFFLVAQAAQKFHADALRRVAFERRQQKCLDR